MFCHDCGKEIADGVKFCPYCGKSQRLSEFKRKADASPSAEARKESMNTNHDVPVTEYAPKAKEVLQQVANTVVASAKSIGEKVNEASDGNAQVYAEKAKETAQDFVNDVQQATKDKDTDTFFKKNNYRNCKIVVGMIAVIIGFFIIFGGNSKYHDEAIKLAEKNTSLLVDIAKINSSSIEVIGEQEDANVLFIIVEAKTKSGDDFMVGYNVFVNMKNGKMQMKMLGKIAKNGKDAAIKLQTEEYKSQGLKIK